MVKEINPDFRLNAWLLDFGHTLRAAVGTRVLLHIIDNPKLHIVPCTPAYCRSVVSWQGQLLPVMDMASILDGNPQIPLLLAIAGYQDQTENITRFGAFLLSAPPTAIAVADTQSCPLPEQPISWNKFALSCFNYHDEAIPILNLARIFS
jgi:chemotaxis signal transduction protein